MEARYERSERSEPRYERAERSTTASRGVRESVRVPRRVVRNWERLVGAAVRADLEAGEQSDWSSEEEGEDDDGFERMARRPTEKRYERSSSQYLVPQSLAAQTDIDAVIEAAEDIQKDDTEVARIRTSIFIIPCDFFLFLFHVSVESLPEALQLSSNR